MLLALIMKFRGGRVLEKMDLSGECDVMTF